MSTKDSVKKVSEMTGLTVNDAFEAAVGAKRKTTIAPENTSHRSTVSGPVTAAKRCGSKLKNYL